jgi:hypothetical protein
MRIIKVKPGTITPVSIVPAKETVVSSTPLRAKHPGERATKDLYLGRIKSHLDRLRDHLRAGDRRLVSPEALLWADRAFPSKTNTLDVLRGIEMTLSRGVPPLPQNLKEQERLRSLVTQWYQRAKELWSQGAGAQLPRSAYDADSKIRKGIDSLTNQELSDLIVALGGTK